MILTFTPNPCVDKTIFLERVKLGTFMRSQRYTCIAGGKGVNTARAVHIMGRRSRAMVLVGGFTGAHVVDMIRSDGMECQPVELASPTRTITTVLESEGHRQTAFFEPGSNVSAMEYRDIVERYGEAVRGATVATFNGTVSDPVIRDLYGALIPIAKAAGALTVLDSHGPEFAAGLGQAPYMIKPNQHEAEEALGQSLDTMSARLDALAAFHGKGVELAVISLGAEGALVSRAGQRLHVVPPVIEEVNPVGSGDAFVAGFAIGLSEEQPLEETARLAVAMGAANASTWDIGHFTRETVEMLSKRVELREL